MPTVTPAVTLTIGKQYKFYFTVDDSHDIALQEAIIATSYANNDIYGNNVDLWNMTSVNYNSPYDIKKLNRPNDIIPDTVWNSLYSSQLVPFTPGNLDYQTIIKEVMPLMPDINIRSRTNGILYSNISSSATNKSKAFKEELNLLALLIAARYKTEQLSYNNLLCIDITITPDMASDTTVLMNAIRSKVIELLNNNGFAGFNIDNTQQQDGKYLTGTELYIVTTDIDLPISDIISNLSIAIQYHSAELDTDNTALINAGKEFGVMQRGLITSMQLSDIVCITDSEPLPEPPPDPSVTLPLAVIIQNPELPITPCSGTNCLNLYEYTPFRIKN